MSRDYTPQERLARTREGLARMSDEPKSTKRPSPHQPVHRSGKAPAGAPRGSSGSLHDHPSNCGLNRLNQSLGPDGRKRYRLRRDGAFVLSLEVPAQRRKRTPPKAKAFHPAARARRPADYCSRWATERHDARRKLVALALRTLRLQQPRHSYEELKAIAQETGLRLSVARDYTALVARESYGGRA